MNNRLRLTGAGTPVVSRPIPTAALRVRGRIAQAMLALHAISPEDAVDYVPEERDAREFDRLRRAGIVKDVAGGRYWFDLTAWHIRDRARSRPQAMWGFGIAVTAAAIAMLFYRG